MTVKVTIESDKPINVRVKPNSKKDTALMRLLKDIEKAEVGDED